MGTLIIEGGSVAYEDSLRDAADEYGRKKARVELRFNGGDEGVAPEHIDDVARLAISQVNQIIGKGSPTVPGPKPVTAAATRGKKAAAASSASGVGTATEVGTAGTGEPIAPESTEVAEVREALEKDPFVLGADNTKSPPEKSEAALEAEAADEFDLGAVQPDTEVTDAALNSAVQAAHKKLNGDAQPIHKLIRSYNPEPDKQFHVRQLTQAQRPDFLSKLSALKAA